MRPVGSWVARPWSTATPSRSTVSASGCLALTPPRAGKRVSTPRARAIAAGRKRLWFWMPGSGRAWSPVSARTRTGMGAWWPSAVSLATPAGDLAEHGAFPDPGSVEPRPQGFHRAPDEQHPLILLGAGRL